MTDDTDYSGLPYTPSIARDLILEVIPRNKAMRRSEIVDHTVAAHVRRGGLPIDIDKARLTAKKALGDMSRLGLVEPTGVQGFWRVLGADETTDDIPDDLDDAVDESDAAGTPLDAERVVGDGDQFVYAYSFPAYAALAAAEGRDSWQIKIGMSTTTDYQTRIAQQLGMCPEAPTVHLVFRVEHARAIEGMLRAVLSMRGQRCADALGKEWFWTSPDELQEIYSWAGGQGGTAAG